ncbi:prefoldin subunit alpha [Candidatus Micrarchaeota archaeon]|nr:prefoldin subunit alpha [Candidatus Micrarchaeota archaeon]
MVSENERQDQMQKTVYEINYLRAQGSELQKQIYSVQALLEENAEATKALSALSQSKGSETLVPLGAGVFARATLANSDLVLIDVGARASVEKSASEAKAVLSERRKKLEQLFNELRVSLDSLATHLQELNEQASDLSAGGQGA